MRAATRSEYGRPDVLAVADIADPEPGPDDLLVRVHATTVNRTDCGILLAKPAVIRLFTGLRGPRLAIPGTDFAGEIVAIGDNVTAFAKGDRVWGFSDNGLSSQAQLMTIDQGAALARIPEGIDYAQAAASGEGAHYALNFMKRGKFRPGQRVCVYGATGAIGSAAVQMLVAKGADVTAFCGGEHVDLVRGLGAPTVVDYQTQDLSTYEDRFDLVFDAVGKSTFAAARPVLVDSGRYLSSELGPRGENVWLPVTSRLRRGPRVDFPVPSNAKGTIQEVNRLLADGRFRPLIDRHFPLDDVRAAYEFVLTGQKLGNVILDIG